MADPKAHLDLVLMALEALTGMGSEEMLSGAKSLNLQQILTDRIVLWRLRQSSPLRRGKGGRKKLDIEEALALVKVSAYLASKHHQVIRQAVDRLEQCHSSPHQEPILADYLDRFWQLYTDRMGDQPAPPRVEKLALKLLVDLLFYSAKAGSKHLWLSLIEL
ncbi:MAG: DUF3038 domain-containing protein [Cyanobacteria bacterium KgW148]|nr:DUF3038 domain-containing protein [Cyanobacteria bacterium KgW148]